MAWRKKPFREKSERKKLRRESNEEEKNEKKIVRKINPIYITRTHVDVGREVIRTTRV